MNKLIIVLVILCSISNVTAWTGEEHNVGVNESVSYGVCGVFDESTVDDPYRYTYDTGMLYPTFISNDAATVCTVYKIYKHVWNENTGSYQITSCYFEVEECIDFQYKVDYSGGGYWAVPDNYQSQISDGFLVKRYFQKMLNDGNLECHGYDSMEDDPENPDVFQINIDIDTGNAVLDAVFNGYVVLDADEEQSMRISQDYGFDIDSVGGEGGSGAISQHIGFGEMDTTSRETKEAFGIIFYAFIPMLFIMLWLKFFTKVSG